MTAWHTYSLWRHTPAGDRLHIATSVNGESLIREAERRNQTVGSDREWWAVFASPIAPYGEPVAGRRMDRD